MLKNQIEAKILGESGEFFSGPCRGVIVPTGQENLAILPYHTPLIALMGRGRIIVMLSEGGTKVIGEVESGVVHVENNKVVVLVNI